MEGMRYGKEQQAVGTRAKRRARVYAHAGVLVRFWILIGDLKVAIYVWKKGARVGQMADE
jgi:hypothetical protein